jgi:hypothetical protein
MAWPFLVPFRRLLRLAGSRWRYSTPPPHGFTSALDGGEWSVSPLGNFTPRETALFTHWIGGWVNPRTGLDAAKKRKFLPCRESNPGRSSRIPSLCRLICPHSCSEDHYDVFQSRSCTYFFCTYYISLNYTKNNG